jgi:hypothetical protein
MSIYLFKQSENFKRIKYERYRYNVTDSASFLSECEASGKQSGLRHSYPGYQSVEPPGSAAVFKIDF